MPRIFVGTLIGVILGLAGQSTSRADIASELLVPQTAKGYLSAPDVQRLTERWEDTKLSQLFEDESMDPFIKDLEKQIDERFETTGVRIGVSLTDLRDVCRGEISLAMLRPKDEAQNYAILVTAETKDNQEGVDALLAKVDKNMEERGAKRTEGKVSGIPAITYAVPMPKSKKTFNAVIIIHEGMLVATDHLEVAQQVVANITGEERNCLADLPAFKTVMDRCREDIADEDVDVRWFVEPLGYAELAREIAGTRRRRRTDLIKALDNQGFDAVEGVGGVLQVAPEGYEFLHRGFAFAPAAEEGAPRFELAAGILQHSLKDALAIQDWIPNGLGSYVTATWDLQPSFEYIGALVDEVAGEEGFFEDLKDSLKKDPNGPMIDLEKDIVAHLGKRTTIITDVQEPITPTSEQFLVAIDLTNAPAMRASLQKALEDDPDAEKVEESGHVIWEIVSEEEEIPDVMIEGTDDYDEFGDEFGGSGEDPLLSNAAISVVKGHLIVASHVEFVVELINRASSADALGDDEDYVLVRQALEKIGGDGEITGLLFSRTDEELYASYELIRKGQMPESGGILGRSLNRIFGPNEKDVVRQQQIDGKKMPEFNRIRKYLGSIGAYIQTEENGWYTAGAAIRNDVSAESQATGPAVTTAAATTEMTDK